MPPRIGPKRLHSLLEQGINLYTLPVQQQFEAFRAMARLMTQAPAGTPRHRPRRLPRHLRPRCMARRRDGRRCQAKVAWDTEHDRARNTKCRVHGGMSTGPRTPGGRRRIGESNRQRAQVRRQAQAQAAAHTEALAAYQAALKAYEELRQHPMSDSTFKAAMMQVQAREVEQRYQACLACGVDPRA